MNLFHRVPFLFASFIFVTTHIHAADLTKIDRTIKKEPAYKNKPKYCLLVFGPETKTRVWLVLDGETLYVDRNGNGDLTEEGESGEKLNIPEPNRLQQTSLYIRHVPAPVPGGKVVIDVTQTLYGKISNSYSVSVSLEDSSSQPGSTQRAGAFVADEAGVVFAPRPRSAPILQLFGPRHMQFAYIEAGEAGIEKALPRGQKGCEFYATVGTPGLTRGTFVRHSHGSVPQGVHPVADFEFPNQKAGQKPIKMRVRLTKRC